MIPRLPAILLATTLAATALHAQTVDVPVQSNVLSINPFGFLFSWYNIEYERAFSATASWSVGAGHIEIGDEDNEATYTSADVRLRYYPSAEAPAKFSAGISFGYSRVNDEDADVGLGLVEEHDYDALSVGIDLGYSWLLGRTRQFFIGTGVGAKRLFLLGDEDEDDETFGYPTLRLSIGYAF